jgi:hypothetical protein
MKVWRNVVVALGAVGLLFPGLLGVMVNFNTYYQRANRSLGADFLQSVYHQWSWNPIWHHVKIFGQEWGNFGRPYGLLYMKGQARFDLWWLDDRWWVTDHPRRFMAAALMLLVIIGLAVSGALVLRSALRRPVTRTSDETSGDADASDEPFAPMAGSLEPS